MSGLSDQYHVTYDTEKIYRNVHPQDGEQWNDNLEWKNIIRVCFKPGNLFESDELYIFTSKRPESYLIPIEADGGLELWNEIIRKELFDAELAIKIATVDDGLYCWPDEE